MEQGIFEVISNSETAKNTFEMVLRGDTMAITAPGQFVNIKLSGFFLRRPISVCDWDADTLTIIYKVVGQGTHKELLDNCDVYRQIAESQLSQSELTA